MAGFVIDTHALVWYLAGSARISQHARGLLEQIMSGQATGFLPVIVLAELSMLVEKRRILLDFDSIVESVQRRPGLTIVPIGLDLVLSARSLVQLPDLHDRFIVATAQLFDAEVITADEIITRSALVPVTW